MRTYEAHKLTKRLDYLVHHFKEVPNFIKFVFKNIKIYHNYSLDMLT